MPSPFPGMDPYLEDPAVWQDFHGEFIYACRMVLLDRLPGHYDAAVGEQVRLVEVPAAEAEPAIAREIRPDVSVSRGTAVPQQPPSAARTAGAATLEPVTIRVPAEEEVRDRWIEIRYRPDNSLVTVIEVLSPTNKTGEGYGEYRAERRALFWQNVNLMELDLLIGGRRLELSADVPTADYYALISRAGRPVEREVYAWGVRRELPVLPVPLRPPDADVALDLAAAFSVAHDRGRYPRRLRYDGPPYARLTEADRSWAQEVAAQARAGRE